MEQIAVKFQSTVKFDLDYDQQMRPPEEDSKVCFAKAVLVTQHTMRLSPCREGTDCEEFFLGIRFFLIIFPHSGIVCNLIRQLGHAADGWGVHRQVDTEVERTELQPHPSFF